MSQYYTRYHLAYDTEVKKIAAYLRERGDLCCGLNKLEELWEEFSYENGAGSFLNPNDTMLYMFESWLYKYDDLEDK